MEYYMILGFFPVLTGCLQDWSDEGSGENLQREQLL